MKLVWLIINVFYIAYCIHAHVNVIYKAKKFVIFIKYACNL